MVKLATVVFGAALAFAQLSASASVVTLEGDDVIFRIAGDGLNDFGVPTVSGDTLSFFPSDFGTDADGHGAISRTHSTMSIWVEAKGSYSIDNLTLTEGGKYSVVGEGGWANAGTSLNLTDQAHHGALVDSIEKDWQGPNAGDWAMDWSKSLGGTSLLHIVLGDTFGAKGFGAGGASFIDLAYLELKLGGISPAPTPVPLPASAWLLGLGLAGAMAASRRRQGTPAIAA